MTQGEYMRKARLAKKLSAKRLSELTGVKEPTIYNMEKGRSMPYLYTAILICDELGISLDEFIGREIPR